MAQQTRIARLTRHRRACMAMPGSWAADRGVIPGM
jgi:hypothetical protein